MPNREVHDLEGVDSFLLAGKMGVGNLSCSLHPAARGSRAAAQDGECPKIGSDFVEGYGEYVVQHEYEPVGGTHVSSATSSARRTESGLPGLRPR